MRHSSGATRHRGWVWMTANTILLATLTAVVTLAVNHKAAAPPPPPPEMARSIVPPEPASPSPAMLVQPDRPYFGVFTPQAPYSAAEVDAAAVAAGESPALLEFFTAWPQPFRGSAIEEAYKQGAVPVVTWEPWAGLGSKGNPYPLADIAAGTYDSYITAWATAAKLSGRSMILRFAHEMNGDWYPWGELPGNRPGDYVRAWRHVHTLFDRAGATNVVWMWAPNRVVDESTRQMKGVYPGDGWVDIVGLSGYQARKARTAAETFDLTLRLVRTFTDRPVLLAETGAQPGPRQAAWTTSLFRWLTAHPDVIGFVWFQTIGNADWRYTSDPKTLAAFRAGVRAYTA